MELWIRSQDRTLLTTVDRIHICQATSNEYDIIGNYCTLGTYKTKKRALEVLDEIQQIINGEITMQKEVESQIVGYVKFIKLNVYEMPKE